MSHPLKQFLHSTQEPAADFASRLGVSRQTIYRIMNDEQSPKPALAMRIVEATGGAVTLDALFGAGGSAQIVALDAERPEHMLDPHRLKTAFMIAFTHVAPEAQERITEQTIQFAAEAGANTYLALSTVTTRQGVDRLKQALKPVIDEVFQDRLSDPVETETIDRAADLAALLYLRS